MTQGALTGLVVRRVPHRVVHGLRDVVVRLGGHAVFDGGVINGLGDRRRDGAQILHIRQQRISGIVGLACLRNGFRRRVQHARG